MRVESRGLVLEPERGLPSGERAGQGGPGRPRSSAGSRGWASRLLLDDGDVRAVSFQHAQKLPARSVEDLTQLGLRQEHVVEPGRRDILEADADLDLAAHASPAAV